MSTKSSNPSSPNVVLFFCCEYETFESFVTNYCKEEIHGELELTIY